jgi:hypothetical protein
VIAISAKLQTGLAKPYDQEIEDRAVEVTVDKVAECTANYQTDCYCYTRSTRAKGPDEERGHDAGSTSG